MFVGRPNTEGFSVPPLRPSKVYVTVPDWLEKYESFRLLYVPTLPIFAYFTGLFKAGGNDNDQVIAIAKTKHLVMFFASFFAVCKYGQVDHSFVYTQFDALEGGFTVPLLAALLEEASNVGLTVLIILCGSDTVMSFLILK